jgi:hypothetical protein
MAEKQWCPGCSREVEGVCHHFNCAIGPNGLDAQSRSSADIVDRLRDRDAIVVGGMFHAIPALKEAADEIERLRDRISAVEAKGVLAPAQSASEPVASVVPCYVPSGKRVALYSKYQDLPIGTELYAAPVQNCSAGTAQALLDLIEATEELAMSMNRDMQVRAWDRIEAAQRKGRDVLRNEPQEARMWDAVEEIRTIAEGDLSASTSAILAIRHVLATSLTRPKCGGGA